MHPVDRVALAAALAAAAACSETPGSRGDGDSGDRDDGDTDGGSVVRCEGRGEQASDSVWTLRSGGVERRARVVIPPGYDPTIPTAVMLNFHGFTSNGEQQAEISRMSALAAAEGFIVVYPEGLGTPQGWTGGDCCDRAGVVGIDDVALVDDLLDELERLLCVDTDRVFSTGLSNGGFLSYRLACELSERIAGIAPVAGVLGIDDCVPARPIPLIHFHGTADAFVPYHGSLVFASVDETIAAWTAMNGCDGESEVIHDQGDARCVRHLGCDEGAPVIRCTIDGGGHTWPGGTPIPAGETSTDLDASAMMWETLSLL
jgi:polyhydroxybutyrate depolymerase